MKSQKQITGLTAKEHKLKNVLSALYEFWVLKEVNMKIRKVDSLKQHIINRQELSELIQGALNFVDRRIVYSMINYLVSSDMINHNPTSQLSNEKRVIMPTNNTKYFIENQNIIEYLNELKRKEKNVHTHTLDSFNESNCSNSENQKENKSKTQLDLMNS